jgi:hypothetical protein
MTPYFALFTLFRRNATVELLIPNKQPFWPFFFSQTPLPFLKLALPFQGRHITISRSSHSSEKKRFFKFSLDHCLEHLETQILSIYSLFFRLLWCSAQYVVHYSL